MSTTVPSVTTCGDPLDEALRALALTLAEATDAGRTLPDLRAAVLDAGAVGTDPGLVTDVLLAAHGRLVGLWSPEGLIAAWGSARVRSAAVSATRVLRLLARSS